MKVKLSMALLAGVLIAAPGFAQTTTTTPDPRTSGQTATMPDPGAPGQTTTQPAPATPDTDRDRDLDELTNEYIISGFVGGSFAGDALKTTVDFGAAFDYLYRGAFGAEFLAGFAPKFQLDQLGGAESDVNNYMANVVAAIPVGSYNAVRPFVSGGVGALTLSQNNNNNNTGVGGAVVNATSALFQPSETHFGGNIGAGIMGFSGGFGIRADVRYFSALGHKNANSPGVAVPGTLLSVLDDVSFWRANVGVAFRF